MTWQFSLAGLAIGTLVGMTGMGGGSLMTPTLILLFGFDARVAVGTDILHSAVFKSVGAVRHRMLGTVHARLALWMLAGSGPLSLAGVEVSARIGDGGTATLERIVGGALVVGGIGWFAKIFVTGRSDDAPFLLSKRDRMIAVTIGASFGFVVGLTSVGSGTFFGLALLLAYPLTAQKIVGTDMLHAAGLLWIAGVSHLLHSDVDKHAMAWLLVGSIPGVLVGSNASVHMPERGLRVALGSALILSGIKILGARYAAGLVAVLVAAVAIVVTAYAGRVLVRRRARPEED